MRLAIALLALALITLVTVSTALVAAKASTSSPIWYPRIVGDSDDEWSKSALLSLEDGHLYLYVVGNKWRQPLVVKIDMVTGSVDWAIAVGNRKKGDLGDWPEFRDVAVCGGKVFAAGFTSKNGAQALVIAIDASSGKVLWLRSYGAEGGVLKGLGIAVSPDCRRLYVVGYVKNELGAKTRDAIVLELDASSGELLKAIRVDFGGDDYFIDAVYAHGYLYAVGMSDAHDTPGKFYDIVVAVFNPSSLSLVKAVDLGNKGIYEVAAISNYKNSGGALAYDGKTLFVLGQMKSVKKGKTSTIVIALDPETLHVKWSVRIYNASDIDVEYYPDQIAVGAKLLYIAGHSWFFPGLWKEGGFIAVLDKDTGAPVAFYIVHDSELRSGMGLHGISAITLGGVDYVAAVGDYYLSKLRIAIKNDIAQVSVVKYRLHDFSIEAKTFDVTKELPTSPISTAIERIQLRAPANGKSNYLVLMFVEPGKAVGTTMTVTKTLTKTQTLTMTRTVVVTYTTTSLATKTRIVVSPTTVYRTKTVSKIVTTTVPTTVTRTTLTTLVKTVTKPVTIATTKTVEVTKSVTPAWAWGVMVALFFIGLGIGIAIRHRR